jgi:hypothetical protein
MTRRQSLLTGLALGLPLGCGRPDAAQRGAPAASTPGAPPVNPSATVTGVTRSPEAQQAVEAVLNAASTRLTVPAAQLRVEQVEQREWRDASLGCPQPGMMYAQVITPGYLVIVAGAGRRLEYHTNTRGQAVLCRET